MPYSCRVSLPGYDAASDTNIDHYALYADQDYILIKEQSKGRVGVNASSTAAVTHNLGYIPMVFVYSEISAGVWAQVVGDSSELSASIEVTSTQLIIHNNYITQKMFTFIIFYDQV